MTNQKIKDLNLLKRIIRKAFKEANIPNDIYHMNGDTKRGIPVVYIRSGNSVILRFMIVDSKFKWSWGYHPPFQKVELSDPESINTICKKIKRSKVRLLNKMSKKKEDRYKLNNINIKKVQHVIRKCLEIFPNSRKTGSCAMKIHNGVWNCPFTYRLAYYGSGEGRLHIYHNIDNYTSRYMVSIDNLKDDEVADFVIKNVQRWIKSCDKVKIAYNKLELAQEKFNKIAKRESSIIDKNINKDIKILEND